MSLNAKLDVDSFISGEVGHTAVELIANERRRQVTDEGYTAEHDADHVDGALAYAAAFYALPDDGESRAEFWPCWGARPARAETSEKRLRELVKAGALIAAEMDRLRAVIRGAA